MLVSSGDIRQSYEVLGLVTAYASNEQSFAGSISGEEAYKRAIERLRDAAAREGADALIYVNLHGNMGIKRALVGEVQMYEVFAWGTAVRLLRCPVCRKDIDPDTKICPHCYCNLAARAEARRNEDEERRREATRQAEESHREQARQEEERDREERRQKQARLREGKVEEDRRLERQAEFRAERDEQYRAMGIEPGPFAWFKALPALAQAIILGTVISVPAGLILILALRALR